MLICFSCAFFAKEKIPTLGPPARVSYILCNNLRIRAQLDGVDQWTAVMLSDLKYLKLPQGSIHTCSGSLHLLFRGYAAGPPGSSPLSYLWWISWIVPRGPDWTLGFVRVGVGRVRTYNTTPGSLSLNNRR